MAVGETTCTGSGTIEARHARLTLLPHEAFSADDKPMRDNAPAPSMELVFLLQIDKKTL